jgi:hypothetical protein
MDTKLRWITLSQREAHLVEETSLLHASPDAIVHEPFSVDRIEDKVSRRGPTQNITPEGLSKLLVEIQDEHDMNIRHYVFR